MKTGKIVIVIIALPEKAPRVRRGASGKQDTNGTCEEETEFGSSRGKKRRMTWKPYHKHMEKSCGRLCVIPSGNKTQKKRGEKRYVFFLFPSFFFFLFCQFSLRGHCQKHTRILLSADAERRVGNRKWSKNAEIVTETVIEQENRYHRSADNRTRKSITEISKEFWRVSDRKE